MMSREPSQQSVTTDGVGERHRLTNALHSIKDIADGGKLRLVIWDFDGVIADSEPLHRETYRAMLVERGCHPPENFFGGLIGRNEGEIWERLISTYGLTEKAGALRAQRIARFQRGAENALKPIWFVHRLLAVFARKRVSQVIVSSGNVEVLQGFLTKWNLSVYFAHVYGWLPARPLSAEKPNVLRSLLRNDEPCLVFEDDPAYLRLAQSFGAKTVGIQHDLNRLEESDMQTCCCRRVSQNLSSAAFPKAVVLRPQPPSAASGDTAARGSDEHGRYDRGSRRPAGDPHEFGSSHRYNRHFLYRRYVRIDSATVARPGQP
ncbi:MAG: HAD family phosphatase [Candidatus Eremiobacteraeota bacterium]|nr:HAD family phosphatase [Candidatus Eremiobacteraeota bacterium]